MGDGAKSLRVAVVGAGPAGFFAAADLLKRPGLTVEVDLFERLPTPYGLVRSGVAPDHQSIKAIAQRYDKDAQAGGSRFRLFGNVEIGRDLSVDELGARYDAVVLAFGAQSNRRMGIPGEELPGVHPASVFVGWYNGHPDCSGLEFDLSAERAVVVGVGNVGLDVARILAKEPSELAKTDISDLALERLGSHAVREVVVLGRHTQAQATYTPGELEELGKIPGCDFVVAPEDRRLDDATLKAQAEGKLEPRVAKNLAVVERALAGRGSGRKTIRLAFFRSPVAVVGEERVRALRVMKNRVVVGEDGEVRLVPTGEIEEIPCGLVFRAIGYKVAPPPGVPMDDQGAAVPHQKGQVLDKVGGRPVPGLFVTGWAKRGPQGVIGTNKPDAAETIDTLLAARAAGALPPSSVGGEAGGDIVRLLEERGVRFVGFSDWKLLDEIEAESGRLAGRPRRKFTDVAAMLKAIGEAKMTALPHDELVGKRP